MPEQVRQFRFRFQRSAVDQRNVSRHLNQFGAKLLADCADLLLFFFPVGGIDPDLDQFMVVERALQFSRNVVVES